jgi:hypothetical protein
LGFVVEIIEIIEIAGVMTNEGEKGSLSVSQSVSLSVPFVSLYFIYLKSIQIINSTADKQT